MSSPEPHRSGPHPGEYRSQRHRPARPRTLSAFRSGPFTGLLVILSAIFMVPLVFVISIALASDTSVSSGQLTIFRGTGSSRTS